MQTRLNCGQVLLAIALWPEMLIGQATSGSILGVVTDPSGSVVADAEVTVRNEGTGLSRAAHTSAEGGFLIPALPPGRYEVTVRKPGFKTLTRGRLELAVDQKLRLDLPLAVGEVTETVSVQESAPALQTQSVETGQVIRSRQILDLPLLGRNFLDLTLLIPGVTAGGGGNGRELFRQRAAGIREFDRGERH